MYNLKFPEQSLHGLLLRKLVELLRSLYARSYSRTEQKLTRKVIMAKPSVYLLPFDQLENPKQVWIGEPGSHEEGLAKLALLTPEVVSKAASREIRSGKRVTLNWDLTRLEVAGFGRQPCQHHIISLMGGAAFDDVYIMNPQQSSQWDGLRHFSLQKKLPDGSTRREFYGGTTAGEILDRKNFRIGMQHWAKEGIAGRGVLIDYASWAEQNDIKYSTFSTHQITLENILAIAKQCNLVFETGDILFLRIGVTKEWETMTDTRKNAYAKSSNPEHAGVEATTEVLKWLWDTRFCAIAGDGLSWEVYPPQNPDMFLHEYIIAGWGMPIGELFDLEALSQACKEHNRWSFFVTSSPLNMPGGVSSPPNAMAIF
ncbi:hypothetical protein F5884DRAFT_788592 [Xylogone sp. PMI_703]|nr:hypothetical protein F5884DRAFT_788592 [Xylogone sp. PMI_703]